MSSVELNHRRRGNIVTDAVAQEAIEKRLGVVLRFSQLRK